MVIQVRLEEVTHQLRQEVEVMAAWPIRLSEAMAIFLYPQAIRILQLQLYLPMPLILHSLAAIHRWAMRLLSVSPQEGIQVNLKLLQVHMDSSHHNLQERQDTPAPTLRQHHLLQPPHRPLLQHSSRTQATRTSRPSSVRKMSYTLS